ncbi:MAG TPA: FtsX-like permease family protein [Conexibacter sp.]|nr:FtsX-like permease family protein [Conexibacter sp.]
MSLSNLVFFYRRRLRARRVQEMLALVGIAVGVALLYSVQVSSTSLSGSVEQLTEGLFGKAQWQLVARGPRGFDERVASQLETSPDVRAAAAVLEAPASIEGRAGSRTVSLIGVDPRVGQVGEGSLPTGYGTVLAALRALALPSAVASAVGARFGDSVTLDIGGRAQPTRAGVILSRDQFGALADAPIAAVPLAYGQELAGMPGRVSRVYVAAQPGREQAVEALLHRVAADRLDVRPVDFDARVFAQAAVPNDQSTGLFAAISAFVGFLFAFNALLLVAGQRRELIEALRLWGFGTGSIVRILVFDAAVLGLIASAFGLALGELLSRTVFPPTPGYLGLAFPVGAGRVVRWETVAISLGSGVLAAVLATLVPLALNVSRRAADLEAAGTETGGLARALRSRWTLAATVALLAVTVVVLIAAPGAAVVGMLALIAAMLLLTPRLLSGVLSIGERLQHRVRSSVVMLAVGELRAAGFRSVAITAIAGIALLGSVAVEGSHRDLLRGLDRDVHQLTAVTDVWVTAPGPANALSTTPFRIDAARRLERTAGVAAVGVQRGGFFDVGDRRVWVLAPPATAAELVPEEQVLEGDPARAMRRLRGHGWVALSEALAREQDVSVGDAFLLRAPRPTRMRVAAIISNLGWTPGAMVLNTEDYARAWQTTDASALRVALDPAIAPGAGRTLVERALGPASALTVETVAEREQSQRQVSHDGLVRLTQIAVLMLGAAALAMAAAMGAMVWQRRERLAAVKLLGIPTRRLWHALLIEAGVLLAVGCTIGTLAGVYGAQLLNRTLTTVTGFPVTPSLPIPVALAAYGSLALIAFAIAAATSYVAAQVPTRTALQD